MFAALVTVVLFLAFLLAPAATTPAPEKCAATAPAAEPLHAAQSHCLADIPRSPAAAPGREAILYTFTLERTESVEACAPVERPPLTLSRSARNDAPETPPTLPSL